MKMVVLTIVAMALLVGGGFIGHLVEVKPDLAPQLAASEARAAALERQVQALRDSQASRESEITALEARLSTASATPAKSSAPKTVATGATTSPAARPAASSAGAKPFGAISEMMKNPAMREMARKQQAAMQDMIYGDLYTALGLSDEDKAQFKQLLADRAGIDTDLGFKLMDDALSADARQAAQDESKQQKEKSNADIRAFLDNDADYQAFEHYDQTRAERMTLTMNKGAFDAEPLTPEQQTQLIDTMHEVALRPSTTPDLSRPGSFDPSQITQADLDLQLQRLDQNSEAVRAAAAAFLSPGQQAILKQVQASQRAMAAAGFEMMKSMGAGAK